MAVLFFFLSAALFLISSLMLHVSPAPGDHVVLEEGYVVTTVFDGPSLGPAGDARIVQFDRS
ncbi:hypothetical protein SAY86_014045 [Trapa natans]|uniref:Uncharacterized protein n=1 Tax=Trapa natans TaxID=22666 RepID=A0AAN7KYE8_TRANT|nr:hypothetical protein SAY86_014045 [Trapa natans]